MFSAALADESKSIVACSEEEFQGSSLSQWLKAVETFAAEKNATKNLFKWIIYRARVVARGKSEPECAREAQTSARWKKKKNKQNCLIVYSNEMEKMFEFLW